MLVLEIAGGVVLGVILLCALPFLFVGSIHLLEHIAAVIRDFVMQHRWPIAIVAALWAIGRFSEWLISDWPDSGYCIAFIGAFAVIIFLFCAPEMSGQIVGRFWKKIARSCK